MKPRFAFLGLAALALASCGPTDEGGSDPATVTAPPGRPADVPPGARSNPNENVPQSQASTVLLGQWVLVTYQAESGFEEAVSADERYTIEFTADGRVAGQADCNRYTGAYSEPAPGRLVMGNNMAVTMAACPPGSRAPDFLRAVSAATRYELVGGELKLFGGGDALTFAREATGEPQARASRGAMFRGLGQEPAWNVEIERGKITLVTDYGAKRIEAMSWNAAFDGARTTFGSADASLTVVVERRACADSMSGEAFEAAVTVTLPDRVLHGCGRFL